MNKTKGANRGRAIEKYCGDCLYFSKGKKIIVCKEHMGGRECPAIGMNVYPMYEACDSFDFGGEK